ncbi:hypothetical protein NA56DRAFT_727881 [Hyaloscypha hepaticicola]|uniref:Ankyrin n=1 Tax=Hyaloscypha hepaticicola TaxID=2082293 RepID=A0A2J6PV18_9HELO|nr:hypothetical protein NA56DRAFT_727881 [Hyaloscypha hepaticicola]
MAPTKPGGRPKIAWTSSRKRKLVRLYLLTSLNIHGIQQALVATDFTPSTRNIQSQLGDLLPNLSTQWRQYRPTETNQMKNRFVQIRHAKANQVSKYSRRRARFAVDLEVVDKGKTKAIHSRTTPYYDPCRHYNENLPPGVPSHFLLPQSGAWYLPQSLPMQRQHKLPEALNDCRFSDKEVVIDWPGPILPDIPDGSRFNNLDAYLAIPSLAADAAIPGPANAGEAVPTPDELLEPQLRASGTSRASGSDTASTRIRGHRISTSSDVPLSRQEYLSWDELVDESMFPPTSTQHPQTSLQRRSCCEFFEKDTFKRTLCNICGFSEMHQLARCSLSDDSGLIDSSLLDRFGNTPLHHAAAAGNTVRVLQLISSAGIVQARNTSGETCLHVLRLKGDVFPEYLEILRKASSFGFQFSVRDYYGTTAADKLDELGKGLEIGSSRMMEATEILFPSDVEDVPIPTSPLHAPVSWVSPGRHIFTRKERKEQGVGLNRIKNKLGYSKPSRAKEVNPKYELDSNGDTKLIATLKSWSQRPKPQAQLEDLIRESDIHMRDLRGYTALAIAARQGSREATSLLLQQGANPNTRSNQKTGVVAHATVALGQAQKEGKDLLYARILSCLTLLIDYGGKAVVDAYDEYALPDRTPNKGKQLFGRTLSIRRPSTQRRIAVDEFFGCSDDLPLQPHSDRIPTPELADTQLSEMPALEPIQPELEDHNHSAEVCPLPLLPVPFLFAMSELRDERQRNSASPLDTLTEECPLPLSPLPHLFAMSELRADSHHRPKKLKLDSGSDFTSMHNHEILRPFPSPLIAASQQSGDPKKNCECLSNCTSIETRTSEHTENFSWRNDSQPDQIAEIGSSGYGKQMSGLEKGKAIELEANQRIKFEERKRRRRGVRLMVGRRKILLYDN